MYSKNHTQYQTSTFSIKNYFSAKAFLSYKNTGLSFFFSGIVKRLKMCVSDWDPSQLNDLGIGHASSVMASGNRFIIAYIKACSWKIQQSIFNNSVEQFGLFYFDYQLWVLTGSGDKVVFFRVQILDPEGSILESFLFILTFSVSV